MQKPFGQIGTAITDLEDLNLKFRDWLHFGNSGVEGREPPPMNCLVSSFRGRDFAYRKRRDNQKRNYKVKEKWIKKPADYLIAKLYRFYFVALEGMFKKYIARCGSDCTSRDCYYSQLLLKENIYLIIIILYIIHMFQPYCPSEYAQNTTTYYDTGKQPVFLLFSS